MRAPHLSVQPEPGTGLLFICLIIAPVLPAADGPAQSAEREIEYSYFRAESTLNNQQNQAASNPVSFSPAFRYFIAIKNFVK
jgi:hypothetical protein